jgi:hypothetical protein
VTGEVPGDGVARGAEGVDGFEHVEHVEHVGPAKATRSTQRSVEGGSVLVHVVYVEQVEHAERFVRGIVPVVPVVPVEQVGDVEHVGDVGRIGAAKAPNRRTIVSNAPRHQCRGGVNAATKQRVRGIRGSVPASPSNRSGASWRQRGPGGRGGRRPVLRGSGGPASGEGQDRDENAAATAGGPRT